VGTHTTLSRDEQDIFVDGTLDGYEGDRRVFSRTWNETVPRDLLKGCRPECSFLRPRHRLRSRANCPKLD